MEAARRNARSIHPDIEIVETSCTTGDGLDSWRRWIAERMKCAADARQRAT
jgi:hydrogenase nickel incorporation protein HypB